MAHADVTNRVIGQAGPATMAPAGTPESDFASSYCPCCSTRLAARSCKMICAGCGYYMSCSDFY
jgi:hypothetical protein